jgi:hypothetical protein
MFFLLYVLSMKQKSQFPRRIEDAIHRLEDSVYAEIQKLVEGRGSAEKISGLTHFLREVERLRAATESGRAWADSELVKQQELPLPEQRDSPEFSSHPDYLCRRGKRQNGTDFYEQRISWESVRRFAELIDVKYGNRSFHPQSLVRDLDLPAYQVYAVLKLFTVHDHIESPRRGTHRRRRGAPLLGSLNAIRAKLPTTPARQLADEDIQEGERDEKVHVQIG